MVEGEFVAVTKEVKYEGGVLEEGVICEISNVIHLPEQSLVIIRPVGQKMSYAVDSGSVEIVDPPEFAATEE